jgi:hypothetical protein
VRSSMKSRFRMPNLLQLWIRFIRRHRHSLAPGVSLFRNWPVSSGPVLVSLAFEKTNTSECTENASFAGRGEQTF